MKMKITIIVRKNEIHEFDNPLIAKAFIVTLQCNQFLLLWTNTTVNLCNMKIKQQSVKEYTNF